MSTRNEATGHLDMTREEWKRLHKDFKSTHKMPNGKTYRSALTLNPKTGATESWPVNITDPYRPKKK